MLRAGELFYWLLLGATTIGMSEGLIATYLRMARERDRAALRAPYTRLRIVAYSAVALDGAAIAIYPRSLAWAVLLLIAIGTTMSSGIIFLVQRWKGASKQRELPH